MKSKPSWPLFLLWLAFYTALDFLIAYAMHGAFLRSDINDALEGALAAAAITWGLALYRWHKSDAGL